MSSHVLTAETKSSEWAWQMDQAARLCDCGKGGWRKVADRWLCRGCLQEYRGWLEQLELDYQQNLFNEVKR